MASKGRTELQPRPARVVARVQLRVEEGPAAGTVYRAEGEPVISVGASPDNQLVIDDKTVSRYHFELRMTADGLMVEDLGSRNGTYVGQLRVQQAVIPPGTRLRLGTTTIAVEDADAVAAPPDAAPPSIPGLVVGSEAMADVARLVDKLSQVGSSVLIQGETGVGKEVVARAIHDRGARSDGPFVVLDCGSMPATLIASHLFGHERGAFTGADQRRTGAFERANGGTVLLDEIGELPLEVQPALLGVLERRRFTRVGGAGEIAVDVRVLAATNRDLRAEVNKGRFRADLYYRLAVARVLIPPLRDRPEDVAPLVTHFAQQITGVPDESPFDATTMEALRRHRWSGNVRELRNVVEGALVMGRVSLDEGRAEASPAKRDEEVDPYGEARAAAIAQFERTYLTRLIEITKGNASEAARRAKMDRPYLLTLLRRHGLR